jgi:hypothetical protein
VESREVHATERPAGTIKPINAEQHVLRITISAELKADLDALRDEIGGSLEELIGDAVRERLKVVRRRRRGAGKAAVIETAKAGSRYNPASLKQAVWKRDRGQCTFVGVNGHRCSSRYRLQIHHLDPHGKGGPGRLENLTLRCQAHNRYAAEQDYGAEHIARAIARSKSRAREAQACYAPAHVDTGLRDADCRGGGVHEEHVEQWRYQGRRRGSDRRG